MHSILNHWIWIIESLSHWVTDYLITDSNIACLGMSHEPWAYNRSLRVRARVRQPNWILIWLWYDSWWYWCWYDMIWLFESESLSFTLQTSASQPIEFSQQSTIQFPALHIPQEQTASNIVAQSGLVGPLLTHMGAGLNIGKALLTAMLSLFQSQTWL